MRFVDRDIRLQINDLHFKAYLENSDHLFEPVEQKPEFVPTSWNNDAIAIRMIERVAFKFNVFSENRRECIINYRNLIDLIGTLKPAFSQEGDLFLPDKSNLTGYIKVAFKGMPNRNFANIHLTGFSYDINKDIGFLEVPKREINSTKKTSYYDNNMKLIPIAYSINIEGKIIQPLTDTIRVGKKGTKYGQVNFDQEVRKKLNIDNNLENKFINWLEVNIGTRIENYSEDNATIIYNKFKIIQNIVNDKGSLMPKQTKNKQRFNSAVAEVQGIETVNIIKDNN